MLLPVIPLTFNASTVGVEEEIAAEAVFQGQLPAELLTGQVGVLQRLCLKEAEHRLGVLRPEVS